MIECQNLVRDDAQHCFQNVLITKRGEFVVSDLTSVIT